MSLSMPLHEFSRLRLVAKLSATGKISLSFQPLEGPTQRPKDTQIPDALLHFDTTCDNGTDAMSVYVSFSTAPENEQTLVTQAFQGQEGTLF